MPFFQPELQARADLKGRTYDIETQLLAPTASYRAAGITSGSPQGSVVGPDAEAIQLHVETGSGAPFPNASVLHFSRRGLPLNKKRLVAFVMLRDREANEAQLIGKGSIELPQRTPPAKLVAQASPPEGHSGAWVGQNEVSGWVEGGANPSIHVRVGMWAPQAGYTYHLGLAGHFGNSTTLLCIMGATPPASQGTHAYTHTIVKADANLPLSAKQDPFPKNPFQYATLVFEDLGYSCTLSANP